MAEQLKNLILAYKADPESVYNTWFINNEERLKAFRTIKSGVGQTVESIERGVFGSDFKGSPLEAVVTAIAEQKQVFDGAAHAFYWKPKLRIPDIYEHEDNKRSFGLFLRQCATATQERQILQEIVRLDQLKIKGLGPATANILYFLHPTLFPPFNTSIVRGFNQISGSKLKLGSWPAYLVMRDRMLEWNFHHRDSLSKDLGALAGLLFEIGSARLIPETALESGIDHSAAVSADRIKSFEKRRREIAEDINESEEHSEMQHALAQLGRSLGYRVWIAQNDHRRIWKNTCLGEFSDPALELPGIDKPVRDTIALIDVLWLNAAGDIVCAFEVEKSTSIYSGILRLQDLSLALSAHDTHLYLIAPGKREKEIKAQLSRPVFRQKQFRNISYILFDELRQNCEAMCRFGSDASVLEKICKQADFT
ncbi:type II restriction enzyme [Paenibacillus forsythiae]|uniref:Type II restriction enzyme n=1 Tax=Paenibacillus forsythiae TaxID=365616 RepID=A0ABU3H661_9BACL|nr:hypothetical protein [Paenibacillus forsythiae]MDT3426308.1 type II restriction enzyme [Paenibacillus forsythiae]